MARIITVHDVQDVENWLAHGEERAGAIGSMGGTDVVDLVAHDGSRTVAVSCEADDVDGLLTQMASPSADVLAVMQRHGVIPPLKTFVER